MDFNQILTDAHYAARNAVALVCSNEPETARDPCGFAWVTVDGRDPLANWCRAEKKREVKKMNIDTSMTTSNTIRRIQELSPRLGDKGYPSGWQWWKPGHFAGQAVRIHGIGATAFRDELAKHGISATVGSRLD